MGFKSPSTTAWIHLAATRRHSNFAVLAGTVPVALAFRGRFPAHLRDHLARYCRLLSERLLRWRDGSICCAVSRRFRNASRLSHKTLSAFCCVRGRVRSVSRHEGGGARGRKSRAGMGMFRATNICGCAAVGHCCAGINSVMTA